MATSTSSLRKPVSLAGKARNHEAKRKWIMRELRSARHQAELTIRNANRLMNFFEDDLTAMAVSKPSALRHALRDAADLGADYAVAHLIGIRPYDRPEGISLPELVADTLLSDRKPPAVSDASTPSSSPSPELSADRALTEANSIIASLQNDGVQIDWSRNPLNDREAELRAAIIRRVEVERMRGCMASPVYVYHDLAQLAGLPEDGTVPVGSDIAAALKKWERLMNEHSADRKREKETRLLDLARRDVAEGFINDDDSEDEEDDDDEYEEA